jgi:hypothetical protein
LTTPPGAATGLCAIMANTTARPCPQHRGRYGAPSLVPPPSHGASTTVPVRCLRPWTPARRAAS